MENFDTYKSLYERKMRIKTTIKKIAVVAVLVASVSVTIKHTEKSAHRGDLELKPTYNNNFYTLNKTQMQVDNSLLQLSTYFAQKGSPVPYTMAQAVAATKKPRLMAAIAVVETNANPTKRYTGYKNRHHGAWQVNPNDWGPVSHDALAQALQAEEVLTTFKKESKGNLKVALNKYGGEKNKRTGEYADKVLQELLEVPK